MLCLADIFRSKTVVMITLLALLGAGFSSVQPVFAQGSEKAKVADKSKKSSKKTDAKASDAEISEKDEDLFLKEEEANLKFLPDIYRCSECGYEQDEPGFCPDHNEVELVKVLAKGRDPLEPAELDGNEDILVDIPLKNLEFRKDAVLSTASESEDLDKK